MTGGRICLCVTNLVFLPCTHTVGCCGAQGHAYASTRDILDTHFFHCLALGSQCWVFRTVVRLDIKGLDDQCPDNQGWTVRT